MRRAMRWGVVMLMVAMLPLMTASLGASARQSTDCDGLDAYVDVLEATGIQLSASMPEEDESTVDGWTSDQFAAAADAVDVAVTGLQDAEVSAAAEEFNTLLISQMQLVSSMFDTMATSGVFGALIYSEQLDALDIQLHAASDKVETACGVDLYESFENSADTASTATPVAAPVQVDDDDNDDGPTPTGGIGTRANPIPIGQTVAIGDDWELTVLSVTPDATDLIMSETSYNDPPAPGHQFFLANVRLTYTGDDSDEFYSWSLSTVGQSAISYSQYDDSCGSIPDELSSRELFTGGTIEGNLCWSIAAEDADSLVLYDRDLDSDERVYLSLMPDGVNATPEATTR